MVHIGESEANGPDLLRGRDGEGEHGALEEAKGFLEAELAGGRRPAREVDRERRSVGISERTLKRARSDLGVISERVGEPGVRGGGAWYWSLPLKEAKAPAEAHHAVIGPLNENPVVEWDSRTLEPSRGPRLNGGPLNPATLEEEREIARIQAKWGGDDLSDLSDEQPLPDRTPAEAHTAPPCGCDPPRNKVDEDGNCSDCGHRREVRA